MISTFDFEFDCPKRRRATGTHFCRICDGGGAAPPPPPPIIYPNELYIIGKGIYRRVRFILDIDKIFLFGDLMGSFREMTSQWFQKKNFKL